MKCNLYEYRVNGFLVDADGRKTITSRDYVVKNDRPEGDEQAYFLAFSDGLKWPRIINVKKTNKSLDERLDGWED